MTNGQHGLVGAEFDEARVELDPDLDLGVERSELDEFGHQPERGKARLDADRHALGAAKRRDA